MHHAPAVPEASGIHRRVCAAATTIARKRAVFYNALELATERGLLSTNPLALVRWRTPRSADAVDPGCVANPDQARALLAAVGEIPGGERLVAFFGCLYDAGMRPSEVLALRRGDLQLPTSDQEWGWIRLSRNDPEVTRIWTDSGRREARQLKHRAVGEVRMVPITPPLAALLREHLDNYGIGIDGRVFRGPRGGAVKESLYTEVWQHARRRALSPYEVESDLVRRPYDLRHSCVSTWLAAGVDSAQIAAWVGHSVGVLHRVYAHVLPGREALARQRIDAFLTPQHGGAGGPQPAAPPPP